MRILIAEDDFVSQTILENLLKKGGHEVVATVDGLEAMEVLGKPYPPRLMILDWMMPRMDGLEVVRRVRTQQKDRPPYIIILTSRSERSDKIAVLQAGADDFLSKPYDPGELYARIGVGRRLIEMQDALANKVEELHRYIEQIKTLRGILPICANCKKIRDDRGYWNQVEAYFQDHTDLEFSHCLCPRCSQELYPEFLLEESDKKSTCF
jgi:phosphoserine phosphatase RsbU/P